MVNMHFLFTYFLFIFFFFIFINKKKIINSYKRIDFFNFLNFFFIPKIMNQYIKKKIHLKRTLKGLFFKNCIGRYLKFIPNNDCMYKSRNITNLPL